jgi:hypothetical protein
MDGQAKALPRHAVTAGGGRAQLLQGARVIGLKTSHSVRSFAHALIETKSSQWLRVALGMLLAGTAYYFGTGPEAIGALVWVAPLPVLIPAFTLGTGQAVVLSLGASLLGGLNMVSYLSGIVPKPLPAAAIVIPAAAYTGSILLARRAARTLAPALAVLAFPTAWTSYEYALSVISPHGTAGSLAYTKKFLPYARMAIMRAVESGFALARSEQQGLVTVADHCGRVAAEARSPAVGEILLVAEVSPGPGHTFYGMTGDWFARLNIVLLGSAAVFLRSSRGRPVGI